MKALSNRAHPLQHLLGAVSRGLLLVVVGAVLATLAGPLVARTPIGAVPGTSAVTTDKVPAPLIDRLRQQAAGQVAPTVVSVTAVGSGVGSGVILRSDGYIVTNDHVVRQADRLSVTLANGRTLRATVVGRDTVDDLAVLKVNAANLPAASFGDSSDLKVGQSVLAIGNPLGISSTVTEGIVSAVNRTVSEGRGSGSILRAVQTSAAINPGNSGGALINLAGRVIGIPTLAAVDPEFNSPANGVGFAIPSNTVQRITEQLVQHGKVVHSGRAAIGIYSETVSPDLAMQFGLGSDHGVLVAKLAPAGAAEKAGMKPGEVIVKIDKTEIGTNGDLLDMLAGKKPGDTVAVTAVGEGGAQHSYKVTLGELSVDNTD